MKKRKMNNLKTQSLFPTGVKKKTRQAKKIIISRLMK